MAVALRLVSTATVLCLFSCFLFPLAAQDPRTAEYRSKANYLTTFPSFVDWPDAAFPSPQARFLICVRGDYPFGTTLAVLARDASPHGRSIEVRWVHKDQDLRSCQIVFVSRSESKRYATLLQALNGAGVLTVGETGDFLAAGGAISFSLTGDSLRFEVNLIAAENAHLKISSRLLTLAWRVLKQGGGS
jgi:hypothetical protein